MKLKTYPEYKDSGLPWLGEVPEYWRVLRIKNVLREVDRRSSTGNETLLSMTRQHGLVRYEDISKKPASAATLVGYKICEQGEVVMNRMQAWSGMFHVAPERGLVSPDYAVFAPVGDADTAYLGHLLRSPLMVSQFVAESKGIGSGFLRLYTDRFGAIPMPLPSRTEQDTAITHIRRMDYLISHFIRNKERLIELLQEEKQAIINHAVTRGIDPDVRLKPSGIDWLGDVPAHWEVQRLKYLVKNVNEHAATKHESEVYIALEHVESWTGRVHPLEGEIAFDSQVKRFQPDDILFGKLRPYLAKVTRPLFGGVCVGEFLVLRTGGDKVLPTFLEQKFRSSSIIDVINSSTFGAKMPRADWTFIGNLCFSFPTSRDEQRGIVMAIGEQTRDIDSTIAHARRQIDLIREYRTRLIADVVTGKVDVRGIPVEDVPAGEALEKFTESAEMEEALGTMEAPDVE